jgi:predicted CoA-substrate-specific enzyme activase
LMVAGIDAGAKATKAVILNGNKVLSHAFTLTGFDQKGAAHHALEEALSSAESSIDLLERIIATGVGRKAVQGAVKQVTEVAADAKGVISLLPNARTIVDMGAEEARVIKCDQTGRVVDFAMNEKCAAGVGAFVETMARALELKPEEMGQASLQSCKTIPLNSQCVVFAESEVVTLMHGKTDRKDIARAVHDAIASRVCSLIRSVGIDQQVVFVGGLARNVGLVDSIRRNLGVDLLVPENPEYVGALGAALMGLD